MFCWLRRKLGLDDLENMAATNNILLQQILEETEMSRIDMSRLLAAIEKQQSVDDSIIALLQGTIQTQRDLSKQLADAMESGNQADLQNVQTQLDAMADTLEHNTAKVVAAVTANTDPNTPASGGGGADQSSDPRVIGVPAVDGNESSDQSGIASGAGVSGQNQAADQQGDAQQQTGSQSGT